MGTSIVETLTSATSSTVLQPGSNPANQDNVGTLQVSGTFTSAVGSIQVSYDPAGTASPVWNNVAAMRDDTFAIENTPTFSNSTTRSWKFNVTGVQQVRLNLSSGTITSMRIALTTTHIPGSPFQGVSSVTSATGTAQTITAASATALVVGPNGTTNPTLTVDTATASAATGIKVTGAAAAGGVALVVTSSGTNEPLTVDSKGSGLVAINDTGTGPLYVGRGSLKASHHGLTLTALGTVQSSTPTSAQLLGGLLSQTGSTGAGTVTLPTGTALSAACARTPATGDTFDCDFFNLGGGQTLTITGATGTTVVGTAAVPSGKNAKMRFYSSGSNTWNIYVTLSA